MSKNNKVLTLYIARDERTYKKDDTDHLEVYGKLHIFYDTPILRDGKWELSRLIGEIPGYMFPDIKEKECRKFISFKYDHENQLETLSKMYLTMKQLNEEKNDNKENKKQNEVQFE